MAFDVPYRYHSYNLGKEIHMQNILLTLQYDGTRYAGWQRPVKNKNEKTVSYKIRTALEKITGEEITLYAGAKTEPGVHAAGQTVSFCIFGSIPPEQLMQELNSVLPQDISVLHAETVPERFRADLNAAARTYEYRVCTSKVYDVFTAAYTYHSGCLLDRDAITAALPSLLGTHDFLMFSGGHSRKKTEKEMMNIQIKSEIAGLLVFTLTADDFLFRMPSLIIGTLLEIGMGKRHPSSTQAVLDGIEKAASPCDPRGLLLRSIHYRIPG